MYLRGPFPVGMQVYVIRSDFPSETSLGALRSVEVGFTEIVNFMWFLFVMFFCQFFFRSIFRRVRYTIIISVQLRELFSSEIFRVIPSPLLLGSRLWIHSSNWRWTEEFTTLRMRSLSSFWTFMEKSQINIPNFSKSRKCQIICTNFG